MESHWVEVERFARHINGLKRTRVPASFADSRRHFSYLLDRHRVDKRIAVRENSIGSRRSLHLLISIVFVVPVITRGDDHYHRSAGFFSPRLFPRSSSLRPNFSPLFLPIVHRPFGSFDSFARSRPQPSIGRSSYPRCQDRLSFDFRLENPLPPSFPLSPLLFPFSIRLLLPRDLQLVGFRRCFGIHRGSDLVSSIFFRPFDGLCQLLFAFTLVVDHVRDWTEARGE